MENAYITTTYKDLDSIKLSGKVKGPTEVKYHKTILIKKKGEDEAVKKLYHYNKSDVPYEPHDDLVAALQGLKRYLIDVMELDHVDKENIRIDGISLKNLDTDDRSAVVIKARYVNRFAQTYALNTPNIGLSDNSAYEDSDQLDKDCKKVVDEVWLYLNGKVKQDPQMKIEFEESMMEVA